jgi:hypothetical protein
MIQANTLFPRFHLAFLQTSSVAVIASSGTLDASVDGIMMLMVSHKNSPWEWDGFQIRPTLQLVPRALVLGRRSLRLLFPSHGRPDSLERRPGGGIAGRKGILGGFINDIRLLARLLAASSWICIGILCLRSLDLLVCHDNSSGAINRALRNRLREYENAKTMPWSRILGAS